MAANIVTDTSAVLAVLLDEPEKEAVVEATMGSVVCAPASLRWEVGNAATAGVKRRRFTMRTSSKLPGRPDSRYSRWTARSGRMQRSWA
jgi:uncharacterized protein with PIN domain